MELRPDNDAREVGCEMISILVPVNSEELAKSFYAHALGLDCDGDGFILPGSGGSVRILYQYLDERTKKEYDWPSRRFPLFRYEVEGGLGGILNRITLAGGEIDFLCEHPGGYMARIKDPFLNQLEIECPNFDELLDEELKSSPVFIRL